MIKSKKILALGGLIVVVLMAMLLVLPFVLRWSTRGDYGAVVVSDQFPPGGWYAHQVSGFDGWDILLTRTEELPRSDLDNYRYGDNISITDRHIAITPEEYVERTKNVDDSKVQYARWSSLYGHKVFYMGFTNENGSQMRQYLFGGNRAYTFAMYPDKQENRQAFQEVINHYAKDSALEKISRDETLRNCKTITFAPREERDIEIDSETKYVTVGYMNAGVWTYAFFNYNDDLSQCTPDVRNLLSRINADVDKKNADQCIEMNNVLSGKESFPSTTDEQHQQIYISLAKEFIKNNCEKI